MVELKAFIKWIFIGVVGLNILSAFAATPSEQLAALLNGFQSMQANFTQATYDNMGRQLQKTSGKMALQRPGKFLWQATAPTKQTVLADGNYVWVYDPDLAQATRKKMNAQNNSNPASLLSGSIADLQQRYNVSVMEPKGSAKSASKGEWFELRPKNANDLFQWIQLNFVNNNLQKMIVADNLGQKSTFTFTGVQINQPIDPKKFVFKAPTGTDVIQQ